jgi:hypothetical protein
MVDMGERRFIGPTSPLAGAVARPVAKTVNRLFFVKLFSGLWGFFARSPGKA